jgi:alcohol dehydrogenase class IV
MTTQPFIYDAIGGRVVFGRGRRADLPGELDRLGAERVLLVAAADEDAIAADVAELLGDRMVERVRDVAQHVPVASAVAARSTATRVGADSVLTVGGGSATGLGKAVALEVEVNLVALPTTYAGSEMTTIWGLSDGGEKRTGKDARVKPDLVVYDPELTLSLPPRIAGASGMNAVAHCVEALYGPGANPVTSLMASEGIRVLRTSLPRVCAAPDDLAARTDALFGAYLAGVALASGGTALHHKACHVLGGMYGLNHGDMNAVLLGHALAYNAPAIPEIVGDLERALGGPDAPALLFDLAGDVGAPTSLEEIGMPESGIEDATGPIVRAAVDNVRTPEPEGIRCLLDDAYHGRRPGAMAAASTGPTTGSRPDHPATTKGGPTP